MKTFLWLVAAAGAVAASVLAVRAYRRRLDGGEPILLGPISAAGPGGVSIEMEIIEIEPLDTGTHPLVVDEQASAMLDDLANEALFRK